MHCLVCDTPDDDRPVTGVSEFDALFGRIVRSHPEGFICFSGTQPWDSSIYEELGYDSHLPDLFSDHPLGLACPAADFINMLAFVCGFWTDYWLFPSEPRMILKRVELSIDLAASSSVTYPTGASHMFSNVDGAYWALYTENLDDIRSVENVWHRTKRYEVRAP